MKQSLLRYLVIMLSVITLSGCKSAPAVINPDELNYETITAKELFTLEGDFSDSFLFRSKFTKNQNAYKVTDVEIVTNDFEIRNRSNGNKNILFVRGYYGRYANKLLELDMSDYARKMDVSYPGWRERMKSVCDDNKYNGHYTVYMYSDKKLNSEGKAKKTVIVHNIEGIPTQEQLDADEAEKKEKKRLAEEQEKAEKAKIRAEQNAKIDAKGKAIAEGYIYHGAAEDSQSTNLFLYGGLEAGHAYYISGFIPVSGGSMGAIEYGDGLVFSNKSNYVIVDYITPQVKAKVIQEGIINILGQIINKPLNVIITGGSGYMKTPVVIDIVAKD